MALARDMMVFLGDQRAKAINGTVAPTVSAAGTTQGTATSLVASINVVTTAAASSGVILPSCEIGDEVEVCNFGANAVTVYPDSGARVNALSANTGFLLATNTACKVRRYSSTRWIANLSA